MAPLGMWAHSGEGFFPRGSHHTSGCTQEPLLFYGSSSSRFTGTVTQSQGGCGTVTQSQRGCGTVTLSQGECGTVTLSRGRLFCSCPAPDASFCFQHKADNPNHASPPYFLWGLLHGSEVLTSRSLSPTRTPARAAGPSSDTREMKIPWEQKCSLEEVEPIPRPSRDAASPHPRGNPSPGAPPGSEGRAATDTKSGKGIKVTTETAQWWHKGKGDDTGGLFQWDENVT